MTNMESSKELIEGLGTIIAALIACWALLRTSKIEYTEKRQRAHWFFDEYLLSVGKCIGDYEKNKDEYYAQYMRYLLYADEKIKMQMKEIDLLLKDKNKEKIIKKVEVMEALYRRIYKTKQYSVRRRNRIECKIDKNRYIKKLKLELQTVVLPSGSSEDSNIYKALIQYYEEYVEHDMVISSDDFLNICKEIGII